MHDPVPVVRGLKPSRQPPSGRRSKPTPSRARCSTGPALRGQSGRDFLVAKAGAGCDGSATCGQGRRPRPSPPQTRLAPTAGGLRAERRFRQQHDRLGRQMQRRHQPAAPPPMMTAQPARVEKSAVILPASFRRCAARDRDLGIDLDLVLVGLQRVADVLQRDPLHVRTEIAGPDELDIGMQHRDVVAHRALRQQHHPGRSLLRHEARHRRGRSGEVRFRDDLGRAFRMRENGDAGVVFANSPNVESSEELMDFAMALPAMIFTPVCLAMFCARYSSGSMMTGRTPSDFTTRARCPRCSRCRILLSPRPTC